MSENGHGMTRSDCNDKELLMTRPVPSLRWFVVLAAFLGLVIPPAAGAQSFVTQTTTDAAGTRTTFGIAAGDLNSDGLPDVVVGHLDGGSSVSVLLNDGFGNLNLPTSVQTGIVNPGAVFLADLNNDGSLDLIAGGGGVSIRLGNGDGTFGPPLPTLGTPGHAFGVGAGDVNGDLRLDVLSANYGSNNVSVFLGNGNGTFQPRQDYSAGGGNTFGLAVADFNSDGRSDVAVVNMEWSNTTVYFGDVVGSPAALTGGVTYGLPGSPTSIAAADVNGDGRPDLLPGSRDGYFTVLLNNGAGAFGSYTRFPAQNTEVRDVAAGDFNFDGRQDLVGAIYWGAGPDSRVSVLPGDGSGSAFGPRVIFPVGLAPNGIVVADFNRDGRDDIATSNQGNGSSPGSVSLLLANNVPVVSLTGPIEVPAGTIQTYNFTVTDPDAGSTFGVVNISCGARGHQVGLPVTTPSGGSFRCEFPDGPAVSDVSILVADNLRAQSNMAKLRVTITLTVKNVAPTVAVSGSPFFASEGTQITVGATASDPDDDVSTLTFAWALVSGSGSFVGATNGSSVVYANDDGPGTAQLKVTVTDPHGAFATAIAGVDVKNVAPMVLFAPDPTGGKINEGSTYTRHGSFSDPGADALWTATVNYGDGSGVQALPLGPPPGPAADGGFVLGHQYLQDGVYTVTVAVKDKDGATGSRDFILTVHNVAPTLILTSASINEGGTAALFGKVVDPGVLDVHIVTINWADGSAPAVLTLAAGETVFGPVYHQYVDDDPTGTPVDTYGVLGMVTDDDAAGVASTGVTVTNLPPVVGVITAPTTPQLIGTSVNVFAPFADAGTADMHTCVVAWGDGNTSAGAVTGSGGSGTCSASHVFVAAGVYTVTMTVTDDDTYSGSSTLSYIVIYGGPGFVTAGGWLNSAAGSYYPDPGQSGRANFGFNARNRDGLTSGQTEFQFHRDGRMNFHSSRYDWLAVSGPWALYAGSGTINGDGDYAFLVSVIDGKKAADRIHRLRMKIWDKVTGAVIYDNNPTAGDDYAMPTLPINNGSIVIH